MPRNFRLTAARTPRAEQPQARKVGTAVINTIQPVGKKDVRLYRAWADQNEWIRAAIDHRKTQVSQAKYDISPIDPKQSYDEETRLEILSLFARPNTKTDSFRGFIEPVIEDLLVLDAGSIENVRNGKGVPAQLWPVDGAQIRLDPLWTGQDMSKPRYFWFPVGPSSVQIGQMSGSSVGLLDKELLYIMQNPATWRVVGFSALETLRETIESEIMASRYNKAQVSQAPPHGVIDLGEDATPENVDQFERYWRTEIAGYKSTAVIGGTKDAKFISFAKSNKDMQFLQWQTYLIRKITAVFGISPQDLGVTFDVNRANAQEQANISEDRGLKPLLHLLETQFNREVVMEFARQKAKAKFWRGEMTHKEMRMAHALTYLDAREHPDVFKTAAKIDNGNAGFFNLQFHFQIPSSRSIATRASIHKSELGSLPWLTVNEVRAEELLPPVEGGDKIIVMTPMGPVRLEAITGDMPEANATPAEKRYLAETFKNQSWILGNPKVGEEMTAANTEG